MKQLTLCLLCLLAMLPARALSHFGWGAEAGTSIEITGHDMSTLNFDGYFGYKNSFIQMAGVGAGVHVMVSNSTRSFPLYAIFRTNFRSQPTLCFADLRAGIVVDNMTDNTTQYRPYVNPSLGFNLARGKTFCSYITIGYLFNGMKSCSTRAIAGGLHFFNVKIGISF